MNRTPVSHTGGIAPLQFRTKAPIDLSHMRVFGSPAQIHVRATIRSDKKLSDRSISGTFIGHSRHGNGYNFLIQKTTGKGKPYAEIDSVDAKFNETFSPHRARHGQLTSGNEIAPDLTTVPTSIMPQDSELDDGVNELESHEDPTASPYGRGLRKVVPRQFLIPGTSSQISNVQLEPIPKPVNNEFQIRDQQYATLNMNVTANEHVTFLMACLEFQRDDITLLNSELGLLMSCSASDDEIPAEDSPNHDHDGVNLDIPDPKSQRDIDRMLPQDAKRFNEATLAEVNGIKKKASWNCERSNHFQSRARSIKVW
jgi:hypothetical protein